jgi:hypothetical protein
MVHETVGHEFVIGARVKALYSFKRRRNGIENLIEVGFYPATITSDRNNGRYIVRWDGGYAKDSAVEVQNIVNYPLDQDIAYQTNIHRRWSQLRRRAYAFRLYLFFAPCLLGCIVILIVHTSAWPSTPLEVIRAAKNPPLTTVMIAFALSAGGVFSCSTFCCCLRNPMPQLCPAVVLFWIWPIIFALIYPDYYFWNNIVTPERGICRLISGVAFLSRGRMSINQTQPKRNCDYVVGRGQSFDSHTLDYVVAYDRVAVFLGRDGALEERRCDNESGSASDPRDCGGLDTRDRVGDQFYIHSFYFARLTPEKGYANQGLSPELSAWVVSRRTDVLSTSCQGCGPQEFIQPASVSQLYSGIRNLSMSDVFPQPLGSSPTGTRFFYKVSTRRLADPA